ncbi:MAG: hypothetical protein ACJ76H_12480, partial [Bacteriovoracaceae bacterium]
RKKIIFFINFFFLASARGLEKKYYYADEWSWTPSSELSSFDEVSVVPGVNLFLDSNFKKSFGRIGENNLILVSGESCDLKNKVYSKKLTQWLSCKPFKCEIISSKDPKEVELLDPGRLEWIKDGSPNSKIPCSVQPELNLERVYSGSADTSIIISSNKKPNLNGKELFVDKSKCNIDYVCLTNVKITQRSLSERMRLTKQFEFKPDIEKCLAPLDLKCLKESSQSSLEELHEFINDSIMGQQLSYSPINWTAANIATLKSCLSKKKFLRKDIMEGDGRYCYFYAKKLIFIDYPVAFLRYFPFANSPVNIELEKAGAE